MRAFRLLLMLSLLFTGASGAGAAPLHLADCGHGAATTDEAHAHHADTAASMQDCCDNEGSCSSDCRMSCATATGVPAQAAAAHRLPGRAESGSAARAKLPVAPPDELLKPPRTRSL